MNTEFFCCAAAHRLAKDTTRLPTARAPYQRALAASLLVLLAACANPPVLDDAAPAQPLSQAASPQAPSPPSLQPASATALAPDSPPTVLPQAHHPSPLVVPPLSTIADTPVRPLIGRYAKTSWAQLPGWHHDDLAQVWPIFLRNCLALMRPVAGALSAPARAAPRAWQPVCAAAAELTKTSPQPSNAAIGQFLQNHLQPWRVLNRDGTPATNTVTGYYEPLVRGARAQTGVYQWPLYAVPEDLLVIDLGALYPELAGKRIRGRLDGRRVIPYYSRTALAAQPPPALVWLDDPVDAAFLQIQGSGRVQLNDDLKPGTTTPTAPTTIRMAYADHNGHPYVSIGRWLAERGELPLAQASMQNIRAWAKRNPQRVPEMLNANPAVVFFREEAITDPELGPRGAYGVALAAQRAIAVDPDYVPLGAPVFLSTTWPAAKRALNRLVFAQDTGAAIKGAARADFYWGFGAAAGEQAGRMKQRGHMWILWPTAAGVPSAR